MWETEILRLIRLLRIYIKWKREVPSFKIYYFYFDGQDKEIKYLGSSNQIRQVGAVCVLSSIGGKYDSVFINNWHYFKKRLDKLRALHYQIMCVNADMIWSQGKGWWSVGKAEDALLEEFFKSNLEFRMIEVVEWLEVQL